MSLGDIFTGKKQPAPLSPAELKELAACEQIIGRHVLTYAETGSALKRIRDQQLYRHRHETFDAYTRDRWQMDRHHAHRLIAASEVAKQLLPEGNIPATEWQARPLAPLSPADQVAAWTEAKATAGTDQPTADQVAAAAEKRRPGRKKTRRPKTIRIRVPGGTVTIAPNRAFTTAEAALSAALAKLAQPAARAA